MCYVSNETMKLLPFVKTVSWNLVESMKKFPGKRLLFTSIIISFGGPFHFGYQLAITNPSQHSFHQFLNQSYASHYKSVLHATTIEVLWSFIVAILFIGAMLGSVALTFVSERAGRKRGLYFSVFLTAVSCATEFFSSFINSFELYTVGRLLLGAALSLSLGLSALYLNESSPKECRGFVSMMTGVLVQFGTVVGSIMAMPSLFGSYNNWWIIYLFEIVILILVQFVLPFIPESPGYLLTRGDANATKSSIRFFYECDEDYVEIIYAEIANNMKENSKSLSIIGIWKSPETRKGTIVGMTVVLTMAFSGIVAINAFAYDILTSFGMSTFIASMGNLFLTVVSLVGVIISTFVIEKFGRRPLILSMNFCIILINILISLTMLLYELCEVLLACASSFMILHQYKWIGFCLILAIASFMMFFAIGPGPLCYFITAEMVGQEARASAQSCASLVQMTCRSTLLSIYLPVSTKIGHSYAYSIFFVAPLVFSWIYLYRNMPETKNRNINEVLNEMKS